MSGEHQKLILKLLLAGRDENPVPDLVRARAQAAELFEAVKKGKTMLGGLSNDTEKKIIDVLTSSSPAQCRAIKVLTSFHWILLTLVRKLGRLPTLRTPHSMLQSNQKLEEL